MRRGWRRWVLLAGLVLAGPGATGTTPTCTYQNTPATGGLATDCATLLAIKDTLVGTGEHTGSPDWAAARQMQFWDHVAIEGTPPRVTSLTLSSKNLSGTIPAALGNLSALTSLNLSRNQLSGEIPAALGNLSNLTDLYLERNRLSGAIPAALGSLSNLTILNLSRNRLGLNPDTGESASGIPAALGGLSNLQRLYLDNNRLSGAIPTALGNLGNLLYLYLDTNKLSGAIPAGVDSQGNPTGLAKLTKLIVLALDNNRLSGEIPAALGNLSALLYLHLERNRLSGPIPAGVDSQGNPTGLAKLPALRYLLLHDNQLSGSIPPALGNLTKLQYLFLSGNQLRGPIPDLSSLTTLQELLLHGNQDAEGNGLRGPVTTASGTPSSYVCLPYGTALPTSTPARAKKCPTPALTSAPGAGQTYGQGDTITVALTFSHAVTVNTDEGTPTLTLQIGDEARAAPYTSGSGTPTLTFEYEVRGDDHAPAGIVIAVPRLRLNGGTLRDSNGRNVYSTHTTLPAQRGHKVAPLANLRLRPGSRLQRPEREEKKSAHESFS